MKISNTKKEKIYNYIIIKTNIAINNIFITVTDINGNVLIKRSSGLLNFKNTKKRNTYVAVLMSQNILLELRNSGIQFKLVIIKLESRKYPELYSIMKQLKDFKFYNKLVKEKKLKKRYNKNKFKVTDNKNNKKHDNVKNNKTINKTDINKNKKKDIEKTKKIQMIKEKEKQIVVPHSDWDNFEKKTTTEEDKYAAKKLKRYYQNQNNSPSARKYKEYQEKHAKPHSIERLRNLFPICYIQRIISKSHNGVRKPKQRRT